MRPVTEPSYGDYSRRENDLYHAESLTDGNRSIKD